MIVILCLGVLAASGVFVYRVCRRLRGRRWPAVWWTLFFLCAAGGAGFAIWSIYLVDNGWRISSFVRFVGFPIPVVYFVFEPQGWTDFVHDPPIDRLILLTDCVADAALALLPLSLVTRVFPISNLKSPVSNLKSHSQGET